MQKQKNYSRKREAIYQLLRGTTEHPSAELVYERLKPLLPNLSLATVYRNIAMFREEGSVISIGTVHGQERFDADVSPHAHFVCEGCGRVLDVPEPDVSELCQSVEREIGGVVLGHALTYKGLCADCAKNIKPHE